jgi:hypothetical protein
MALNDPVTGATLRRFEDKEQNPVCRMIRSDAAGLSRYNACDRKFHSLREPKSDSAFRHLQERISWLNLSECDLRKA